MRYSPLFDVVVLFMLQYKFIKDVSLSEQYNYITLG